ncbi:MAG: AMP-binding protein [Jatrophihabitans sp.]
MTQRTLHLGDIIEALADAVPDHLAVTTGRDQLTYRELDERATRLAHHLAGTGVGPGDRVAIHSENCLEWIESFYACLKIRAVPININFRYVTKELRYLYDDADCVASIVAPRYAPMVESLQESMPALHTVLSIGPDYEAALAAASPERDFGPRSPDDEYVVYTGGTTGMPKGVLWRQEDIVFGAMNTMRQGRPISGVEQLAEEARSAPHQLRLLTVGPMMHGGSQWIMGAAHLAGGALILYCEPAFDAYKALQLASDAKANVFATMGDAVGRPLAEAISDPNWTTPDLSSLIIFGNGAAPLSTAVREQLKQALPHAMILDSYGASETGAAASRPDSGVKHAAPRFDAGTDVTVVKPDLSAVSRPGEVGMLARSGHIPLGYIKDPERTAKTFPVIAGKRWVIPGDYARIEEDGSISLLGRGSTSINTGGEKVYPEEVEAALKEHPAVMDAAVIGTPHPRWGEQVTALVTLRVDHVADQDELREHCRPRIAAFKIPKSVLVVVAVPRTAVGKVDYPQVKKTAVDLLHAPPSSS